MKPYALLIAVVLCGCHDNSPAPAPSVQPVAAPTPSMASNSQLPQPVQTAFAKDRKDSKILKIKHRMNPDGEVHYTIDSVDPKSVHHTDEYRADGVKVSQ